LAARIALVAEDVSMVKASRFLYVDTESYCAVRVPVAVRSWCQLCPPLLKQDCAQVFCLLIEGREVELRQLGVQQVVVGLVSEEHAELLAVRVLADRGCDDLTPEPGAPLDATGTRAVQAFGSG
jgi:hypothetical protein